MVSWLFTMGFNKNLNNQEAHKYFGLAKQPVFDLIIGFLL